MSDALGDLLRKRAASNEPPEFAVIKQFVLERYKTVPALALSNNNIVITVPGAALAGSLRMDIYQLQQLCDTKRRLVIRIG